jgi:hypothetical protein
MRQNHKALVNIALATFASSLAAPCTLVVIQAYLGNVRGTNILGPTAEGIIFLLVLTLGAVCGIIISTLIVFLYLFKTSKAYESLATVIIPPLIISTICVYSKISDIKYTHAARVEQSKVKNNPEGLKHLIEKIKKDPFSATTIDKGIIWQSVFGKNKTIQEELPFLLEFFKNDASATGGLMEHNILTEEQIRFVYRNFKQTGGGWARIYDDIIATKNTPKDIIYNIIEDINSSNSKCFQYMLEDAQKVIGTSPQK